MRNKGHRHCDDLWQPVKDQAARAKRSVEKTGQYAKEEVSSSLGKLARPCLYEIYSQLYSMGYIEGRGLMKPALSTVIKND